ncbi:hypothetical protein V6768_17515 [Tistrella mobilis]
MTDEQAKVEKLPNDEVRPQAARPTGCIDDVFHILDGKVSPQKPLTIDEMNDIAAAGWAGTAGDA